MKYCPFLPFVAGSSQEHGYGSAVPERPRECMGVQCMLWNESRSSCSLGQGEVSGLGVPSPVRRADNAPIPSTEARATPTASVGSAASEFDTWFTKVKTGSSDADGEVAGPSQADLVGDEETADLSDLEIETQAVEQLSAADSVTCAGCGNQLPKGALWCPTCNDEIGA